MALVIAILASFIIAGPVVLLRVSRTEQQVTELWLNYHRLRDNRGASDGRDLDADLATAMERVRENHFFSLIQNRAPEVGNWLNDIESAVFAMSSGESYDHGETESAFAELSSFMRVHAQNQYRALQTVIWSAILLLAGTAALLTYLYTENRKLTNSLSAALEAKSRQMQETHHRVKNNLALVASLVNMKEHSLGNALDLSDLRNRIGAIERVHEMLSHNETGTHVPLQQYVRDLTETALDSVAGIEARRTVRIAPIELPAKKAVALGIIINELITNAAKHAFSQGADCTVGVFLEFSSDEKVAVLTVQNSGTPLPEDFDLNKVSSLGLQLVTGLAEQLSGILEVRREPQTAFVLRFPV